MSGTSAVVHEVWCYTKREDKVESAVRAVRASVKSAASQRGASVWVWTKEETQTAIPKLKEHLSDGGIEIGEITEPQKKEKADVYVEVRVETGVVAAWRVHVHRTEHVASAVKEEPATVEDELKAAKKALEVAAADNEKLHENMNKVMQMVREKEEELAKYQNVLNAQRLEISNLQSQALKAADEKEKLKSELVTAKNELRDADGWVGRLVGRLNGLKGMLEAAAASNDETGLREQVSNILSNWGL
jgi:chromosome segregation ATPase